MPSVMRFPRLPVWAMRTEAIWVSRSRASRTGASGVTATFSISPDPNTAFRNTLPSATMPSLRCNIIHPLQIINHQLPIINGNLPFAPEPKRKVPLPPTLPAPGSIASITVGLSAQTSTPTWLINHQLAIINYPSPTVSLFFKTLPIIFKWQMANRKYHWSYAFGSNSSMPKTGTTASIAMNTTSSTPILSLRSMASAAARSFVFAGRSSRN